MTMCSFIGCIGECPLYSSAPISRKRLIGHAMKGPVLSGHEFGMYSMVGSLFRIQCVKSCERAYYILECIVEHSNGRNVKD